MSKVPKLIRRCSAAVLMLSLAAGVASAAERAAADGQARESRATTRQLIEKCGNLPFTEVVVNSKGQNTDSTSLVDIEGSLIFFNVGGAKDTCVLATLSAQAFAPGPGAVMRVRALLDNKPSIDGEIQLVAESDTFSEAHTYTFLFVQVPPGQHTFRMEYRSVNNDDIAINDFNLNVRHR